MRPDAPVCPVQARVCPSALASPRIPSPRTMDRTEHFRIHPAAQVTLPVFHQAPALPMLRRHRKWQVGADKACGFKKIFGHVFKCHRNPPCKFYWHREDIHCSPECPRLNRTTYAVWQGICTLTRRVLRTSEPEQGGRLLNNEDRARKRRMKWLNNLSG